jgi:small basic protein
MRYAFEQRRLVRDQVEEEYAEAMFRHRPSYVFYGAAIAIGFLLPTLGVALYLLIALYLGVPARAINRLVRLRRVARGSA